ncbi:sulfate transporter, partial [Candidatus Bipolaricaulota bacterium]|nr:sulfate transporter [Candidatus Bipolaricaulota bacterium]
DFIPVSVVRGIQLGLAFLLLETSAGYITENVWLASGGIGIVLVFLLLKKKYSVPNLSAFIVLLLGVGFGIYFNGAPEITLMEVPKFSLPKLSAFPEGIVLGALPQFFLSVGNAILATSLLFKDLLGRKVNPDRLSQSMGVMCIAASLFGGFPTCHGSGGLSGQYRFGARTGGSNLILGTIYLGIAFIAGSASFLSFYPVAALGALLVFIGLELASAGAKTDNWTITLTVAVLSFVTNLAIGFAAGLVIEKISSYFKDNS